ncbi:MAG TPA: cytidylate kinase-like family protein, partial [Verrucomicrobiae bacterium]
MSIKTGLDKCPPIISSELQFERRTPLSKEAVLRPVVTISRQSGSGAHSVAEKLAAHLEAQGGDNSCPWKVFDHNLVREALAEHSLPRRLARFMTEDGASQLTDTMDELLGTHPPSDLLVRHMAETILRLAKRGNVILIGRGANIITGKMPNVLHVRLVGSLEKRAEHLRRIRDLGKKAALELIRREDRGRR